MQHQRVVFLPALLSLLACASTPVKLVLPEGGSLAERQKAYEAMKPVRYKYTLHPSGGTSLSGYSTVSGVVLEDGRQVRSVKSLLSVVAPDSTTATYVRRSRLWKDLRLWPGLIFGAGTAAALGMLTSDALWNSEGRSGHGLFMAGMVTAAISLIAGAAPLVLLDRFADDQAGRAFQSYDRDLKRRLKLDEPESASEPRLSQRQF